MIRSLPALTLVVSALVPVAACAPPGGPQVRAHSTVLPLTGPCPVDGSAGTEFTSEVDALRLTVSGADIQTPVVGEGDVGAVSVEGVPIGVDRTVALFGLIGAAPQWRGVTRGIEVRANEETAVDVLMARRADITCSRGSDADPRAFHTATVLKNGNILVVGGAKTSTDASSTCVGCRSMEASSTAAVFEASTGKFLPTGPLSAPRMFHTATLLADGRVVVAGGARRALVATPAQHPFPVVPQDPLGSIEIYDPDDNSFRAIGEDPAGPRIFAAAAPLVDGAGVIITGGIPAADPVRNDLRNALRTTTICGGDPIQCSPGPDMVSHRAGHVAFTIEPDGVFVWGGSIDLANDGFKMEALRSAGAFEILQMRTMNQNHNVFFAAGAQYVSFRMLIAGGLRRDPNGVFTLAAVDVGGLTRGQALVYDPTADTVGGIVTGTFGGDDIPMAIQSPRFFAAAAPLPGDKRALVAGGFSDLDFTPSGELELYDQDLLSVDPLQVGGAPKALREARGAVVAAANGDGTVVFFGGEVPSGTGRVPSAVAEIFADPQTPPGVAE